MKMKKIFSSKYGQFIVALLAGSIVALSCVSGLFKGLEYFFEDILVSEKPIKNDIVILSIDSDSISKIGQWPWPRKIFADAINLLKKNPPKVLALDIVFAEPSRFGEVDDAVLALEFKNAIFPIVLPAEANSLQVSKDEIKNIYSILSPLPRFLENKEKISLAHSNLLLDQDGIVRKFPLLLKNQDGSVLKSFSLQATELGSLKNFSNSNASNITRIVYSAKTGGIKRIPFWRIFNDENILNEIKDKIVLLGVTSPDLHDEQLTPFSRGVSMPGVEIQANIVNMLLSEYSLKEIPIFIMILVIFAVSIISSLSFLFLNGVLKPIFTNFIFTFVLITIIIIFFTKGVIINFIHINIIWILTTILLIAHKYFLTEKNRREIKKAFSKYVSKDVLDKILCDISKIKLGGEERNVSIFFSDIRGFTTLSETMTPTHLTSFLNKYLTFATDIIIEEKGIVDKYIGDAIMAFWGAPLSNTDHALSAVKTSLKMIEALKNFNKKREKEGKSKINIGIGLNSGKAVIGNMGSNQRLNYTAIGDAVNLASRFESLTKQYRVKIIVGEALFEELNKKGQLKNITIREIDRVKVKGKNIGVAIYEIIEPERQADYAKIKNNFTEALNFYYSGNWDDCIKKLDEVNKIFLNDGPSQVLKERCEYFKNHPNEKWTGVYEFKTK